MTALTSLNYILLRPPERLQVPRPPTLLLPASSQDLLIARDALYDPAQPLHFDLETTGLDATDPDARIVGLGLANSLGCFYIDVRAWTDADWAELWYWFTDVPVVAFNAAFDYAWLYRHFNYEHFSLLGCSHVLFRMLANEDYPGQKWNLEVAQRSLLGWDCSNKDELGELLIRHKLVTKAKTPDKGRMSELADLEPQAFGHYCALDAEASWQLWDHLMSEADRLQLPGVLQYATEEWPTMITLLAEQQFGGITIDRPALTDYYHQLLRDIAKAEGRLRTHPALAGHVSEWEAAAARDQYKLKITTKRTKAKKADHPIIDPSAGGWFFHPSAAENLAKFEREAGGYWYREETRVEVSKGDQPVPHFNWESDPALRWLLWERVYPDRNEVRDGPQGPKLYFKTDDGGEFALDLTEGGQRPVGKEVMPVLGEIGKAIAEYNRLVKLRGYVESYLAGSARDGRLHPRMRAHGTSTGRLSAGG